VVAVGVHDLDQLLAGVVRAVLVKCVVKVQEQDLDVLDFVCGLVIVVVRWDLGLFVRGVAVRTYEGL
jgi:hypothetical protein